MERTTTAVSTSRKVPNVSFIEKDTVRYRALYNTANPLYGDDEGGGRGAG